MKLIRLEVRPAASYEPNPGQLQGTITAETEFGGTVTFGLDPLAMKDLVKLVHKNVRFAGECLTQEELS